MSTYVVDPYIQRLMMFSPWLAYGVYLYGPLIPYPFTVTAAFTAAGTPAPILDQSPDDNPLSRDLLIEEIDVDIQTKDFNTASLFKPEADLAYDYTSGIQTTIEQRGAFGRQYDQIPLKGMVKMVSERRPLALLKCQKLLMSFYVTTPLPSDSTVITVTFLAMTCLKDPVFRMDPNLILDKLDALGYVTDQARKVFLSAD
jgi:hypothetical protein